MFRQVIKYRRKIPKSFLVAFEEGDVKMTRLYQLINKKEAAPLLKGSFSIFI